jgi:hypothetical protein
MIHKVAKWDTSTTSVSYQDKKNGFDEDPTKATHPPSLSPSSPPTPNNKNKSL